jgi:hypothetical protein
VIVAVTSRGASRNSKGALVVARAIATFRRTSAKRLRLDAAEPYHDTERVRWAAMTAAHRRVIYRDFLNVAV